MIDVQKSIRVKDLGHNKYNLRFLLILFPTFVRKLIDIDYNKYICYISRFYYEKAQAQCAT